MTRLGRAAAMLFLAVAAAAAGCSGATTETSAGAAVPTSEPPPASSAPTTTVRGETPTTAPSTSSTRPAGLPDVPETVAVPPTLEGLPLAYVAVEEEPLLVAIAATGAARRQGLMAVTDLLDLDGMLFAWTSDTAGGFWMRDTVLPLDIAFFDVDGALVVTFPMEPCDLGAQCPVYDPGATYRYALETAQGTLELTDGAQLGLPEGLVGSQ